MSSRLVTSRLIRISTVCQYFSNLKILPVLKNGRAWKFEWTNETVRNIGMEKPIKLRGVERVKQATVQSWWTWRNPLVHRLRGRAWTRKSNSQISTHLSDKMRRPRRWLFPRVHGGIELHPLVHGGISWNIVTTVASKNRLRAVSTLAPVDAGGR